MRVIISGGGTGGHIFPAIAIADKIKELRADAEILFVGAQGRMEMERIPKAGYEIEGLWISGFQRKLTTRNILFPFKLIHSLWKARGIIKRFKPVVAIGVGGYASGPLLEMATRMGVKTLIQEQNSFPGITNRLLGKKVDRICVAYPEMEKFFPKEKLILTGNPMRASLKGTKENKATALKHFGLEPGLKTILLFGGSLGARSLNEGVVKNIELLKSREDVQMIWQAGKMYYDDYKSKYGDLDRITLVPFIDRMDLAYEAADLAITRAGALSISELALMGQASLLIPSPNVSEDHQTKNAMSLVTRAAAEMIKDVEVNEKMIKQGLTLLDDEQKLSELRIAIKKMAKPDAASLVVEQIMKLCK